MLKMIKKWGLHIVFMLGGIILLFVLKRNKQMREEAAFPAEDS